LSSFFSVPDPSFVLFGVLDRYLPIREGTKNMVEVFLLSLCCVSGSELRFSGVVDSNLQIREQRKKIVV